MREERRFEIRCPVTVHLSNGPDHQTEMRGVLYDIGVGGARIALDQPLVPGTRLVLLVHFQTPDKQVTTIRFEGIVQRLREEPRFEVAVGFRGTGRFQQNRLSDLLGIEAVNADRAS
jgi:c-di-GMP-binding flagellar brake protein YcgR